MCLCFCILCIHVLCKFFVVCVCVYMCVNEEEAFDVKMVKGIHRWTLRLM